MLHVLSNEDREKCNTLVIAISFTNIYLASVLYSYKCWS